MSKQKNKKRFVLSFHYFVYDFVKWFLGWPLLFVYRLKRRYISPSAKKKIKGGAMISCNHVSMEDPFIVHHIFWYRRPRFCVMSELSKKGKFWSWLFKKFLTIPIDRENGSFETMAKFKEAVEEDGLIIMFPEGHITVDSEKISLFKPGVVLMAYRANIPIIPIYFRRRKHWYNATKVIYGEQIDVRQMIGNIPTHDKINEIAQYIYEKEMELFHYYDNCK